MFQRLRIILFLDIDGVLRVRKGPVPQEIVKALRTLAQQHWVRIVPITGAPMHQLPPEILWPHLPLYRAFAESGGVEHLYDGTPKPETTVAGEFQTLISHLEIDPQDGLLHIPALEKTIICEGRRHTSFTAIMGETYPPYPNVVPTAAHHEVEAWLENIIRDHALPFLLLPGHERTYSYIDVVHQHVDKAWRVGTVLGEVPHDLAFYIGDGTGDEAAMARSDIIPVALANSTPRIKRHGKERGFVVEKEGPDGTYEFLTALTDFLQQT
ncbi:MAG: hypothetical protein HY617_02320 [Candidatus Sungbacteria bacterium]|nr:hypothetical protein [Candidatus Sungbacteria bacterium]